MTPGSTIRLSIRVDRLSGPDGAVRISAEPPPGITIAPLTVPDGESEGELVVTAAADASYEPFEGIRLKAEREGSAGFLDFGIRIGVFDGPDDLTDGHAWLEMGAIYDLSPSHAGMLVAGSRTLRAGVPSESGATISRLDADGRLDVSWGDHGTVTLTFGPGIHPRAEVVRELPDGRVMVAGRCGQRIDGDYVEDRFLVRLTESGAIDASFGDGGWIWLPLASMRIQGMEIDSEGRILQVADGKLSRRISDGALDETFGAGGIAELAYVDTIAVRGTDVFANGGRIARLHPDGRVKWDVEAVTDLSSHAFRSVWRLVVRGDVLYATGSTTYWSPGYEINNSYPLLAALRTADGAPLEGFGDDGITEMWFRRSYDGQHLVPRDGELLLLGSVPGPEYDYDESHLYHATLGLDGALLDRTIRDVLFQDGFVAVAEIEGDVVAACIAWAETGPAWYYLLRIPD